MVEIYIKNRKFEEKLNKRWLFSKEEEKVLDEIEQMRSRLVGDETKVPVEFAYAHRPESAGKIRTVSFFARRAAKSRNICRFLYALVRKFKPRNVLEFGTSLGISGAYFATALNFNEGDGKLITLEGQPRLASLARKNFQSLNFTNVEVVCGLFEDTLEKVLLEHSPLGCVYHDGNITADARIEYFKTCYPLFSDKALFLLSVPYRNSSWKLLLEECGDNIAFAGIVKNKGNTGVILIK